VAARDTTTSMSTSEGVGRARCEANRRPSPRPFLEERHMNWDRIEGDWKQARGTVQAERGELT
jgi:hypothetical protein